jgi:hypothetical protein
MDVMLGVMKPRRLSQTMIVAIKDAERCSCRATRRHFKEPDRCLTGCVLRLTRKAGGGAAGGAAQGA